GIVGTWEGDAVDEHELAAAAGDVNALPQGEGAEEDRPRITGEVPHERADRLLALAEHGEAPVETLAHRLGGLLRRTHRGEEPEGPPPGRPDEGLDLVERLRGETVAAGGRQVLRDVGDALLGVVEGGPDVETGPPRRPRAPQP